MKLRSVEELIDRVSGDLAWRRAELTAFHRAVAQSEAITQNALLRGSVALLYAHWEGFVKEAAYLYLCFLASRRLSVQQLRPELVGLAMRAQISQGADTRNPALHAEIVRSLREGATERAKIPNDRTAVRTESNLSFRVLVAILTSIGLDSGHYDSSHDLIDAELVASRNRIVHGEYEVIALSEWRELRDAVLTLMSQIGDEIMNAAADQTFLAWRA